MSSLAFNSGQVTVLLLTKDDFNCNAPSIRGQMECSPGLSKLQKMKDSELRSVRNFMVETAFGKAEFLEPVDLRRMVLDEIICFMQDSVEIDEAMAAKC